MTSFVSKRTTWSTQRSAATLRARSGITGRAGPLLSFVETSLLTATTSRSASAFAPSRYRRWPTWKRSKMPLAIAIVLPAAVAAARSRGRASSATRVGIMSGSRAEQLGRQLLVRDGGGTRLQDLQRAGHVGETGRLLEVPPRRQARREGGGDGVAGAGDVHRLRAAVRGDVERRGA